MRDVTHEYQRVVGDLDKAPTYTPGRHIYWDKPDLDTRPESFLDN